MIAKIKSILIECVILEKQTIEEERYNCVKKWLNDTRLSLWKKTAVKRIIFPHIKEN